MFADELADIFDISLSQAIVPRCFCNNPITKKSVVICLKDSNHIIFDSWVAAHVVTGQSEE